jgi:hypothetical protein
VKRSYQTTVIKEVFVEKKEVLWVVMTVLLPTVVFISGLH